MPGRMLTTSPRIRGRLPLPPSWMPSMRSMATVLALLLALCLPCQTAQPRDDAMLDIDRFINNLMRRLPEVPSVALSVVRDGKPYYTQVYGNPAGTAYYIGSTTKAYTGLACAVLAQRGKLDLDAPISKYLPEV